MILGYAQVHATYLLRLNVFLKKWEVYCLQVRNEMLLAYIIKIHTTIAAVAWLF